MTSTYPYPFSERSEVVDHVPPGARTVLDVGCGLGGFGRALRRVDPSRTIWGLEPHEDAARAASPHYDSMLVGPFPTALADCPIRFDCMVFNDVLEHLVDPWSALRDGLPHLVPGGAVVASIPNVRFLRTVVDLVVRGNWVYTESGVLDRTHLRFFTRRSMVSLFSESGVTVEQMTGINSIGHSRAPRLSRYLAFALGDFSYTDFLVSGRLTKCDLDGQGT